MANKSNNQEKNENNVNGIEAQAEVNKEGLTTLKDDIPEKAEFEDPAAYENVSADMFEFVQLEDEIKDTKFEGEAIGFFKDAMLRFVRNKASVASFIVIAILVIMAIIGPSLNQYSFEEQNIDAQFAPPRVSWLTWLPTFDGTITKTIQKKNIEEKYKDCYVETLREFESRKVAMCEVKLDAYKYFDLGEENYWFGSDYLGRDLWTRLWRGTRVSFMIAVLAMSVNIFVGVVYGAISGYYGGVVDLVMQRIIEVLGGIPLMVVIILFVIYYGPGILPIAFALCLTGWIGTSRMIRAQFFKYREMEYVLASRTLGASDLTLIFRHILPNAIGIIITMAALEIPIAIFEESFLAYIGLGIQAPEPSIGVLLSEGQKTLLEHPHQTLFPALTISILMISFNLLGNGLRDAFDPTLRGIE